jgi:hypothetical protein
MADIHLEEARFRLDALIPLRKRLVGPIAEAARAFANNMSAARCNLELLRIIPVIMSQWEKAAALAVAKIKGGQYLPEEETSDSSLEAKIQEEIEKITDDFQAMSDKELLANQERVLKNLNYILGRYVGNSNSNVVLTTGAAHLFQNMIVGIWAAFEVLCNDLLQLKAGSDEANYQKLTSIQDAFRDAFCDQAINQALGDRTITGLYLLRNLITHKMGLVDAKFKRQCREERFDSWAGLPEKEPFPIEGSLIKSYGEGCLIQGCKLIEAVNNWLGANQTR